MVLADTEIGDAAVLAERLCRKVAAPAFARVPVTASFGVSSNAAGAETLQQLINQADESLYASKEGGRNRVTRWDRIQTESDGRREPPRP